MTGVVAVIRIKGHRRVRSTTEDAMKSLRLTRPNHCVVVPATPEYLGQLQQAKDYLTWGTIGAKDLADLIRARGRLEGDKPVTDEVVRGATPYPTIDEFAAAIAAGQARYQDLKGAKPIFRLNPPKKGFKGGIKRGVGAHGNLGYRGDDLPKLLARMI